MPLAIMSMLALCLPEHNTINWQGTCCSLKMLSNGKRNTHLIYYHSPLTKAWGSTQKCTFLKSNPQVHVQYVVCYVVPCLIGVFIHGV